MWCGGFETAARWGVGARFESSDAHRRRPGAASHGGSERGLGVVDLKRRNTSSDRAASVDISLAPGSHQPEQRTKKKKIEEGRRKKSDRRFDRRRARACLSSPPRLPSGTSDTSSDTSSDTADTSDTSSPLSARTTTRSRPRWMRGRSSSAWSRTTCCRSRSSPSASACECSSATVDPSISVSVCVCVRVCARQWRRGRCADSITLCLAPVKMEVTPHVLQPSSSTVLSEVAPSPSPDRAIPIRSRP